MSTIIPPGYVPPVIPEPRPGELPERGVPPFGPGSIPETDPDVPMQPFPGEEPSLPPDRDPFPEQPVAGVL